MNTQEKPSGYILSAIYVDIYGYMWKIKNCKVIMGIVDAMVVEPYPNKNIGIDKTTIKRLEIIDSVRRNSIDILHNIRWKGRRNGNGYKAFF